MRKLSFFIFSLLVYSTVIFTQTVIENPEKPLGKNAGRVVELGEVMQISDIGDKFYFQFPSNLKVAPDGSIFIKDEDQLLQFSPSGKFIHNFFKKGQGPGEMGYVVNYYFHDGNIIIHSSMPPKILWFDFGGELIKEFKIYRQIGPLRFRLFHNNQYYFFSSERAIMKGEPKIVDLDQQLISVTPDGKEMKRLISFPIKKYVVAGKGGGRVVVPVNYLITVLYRKKFLFVSNTMEYLMKLYDVEENRIIRAFKRKYKRVKTPKEAGKEKRGGPMIDGKVVTPPRQKYLIDIQNLFVSNDQLWVMTSTKDKKKRTLIDVFNFEGKYIDNFYMRFPENIFRDRYIPEPVVISGNIFYALEKNKDETYEIGVYKIKDKNKHN